MRWLLLEEVLEVQKGVQAVTRSRMPQSEFSPEFLMIEMMAQTAGILLGAENNFKSDVVFGKMEGVQFLSFPAPKAELRIAASGQNLRLEGSWLETCIESENQIVAKAKLLLTAVNPLVPGKISSTTFHEAFLKHFKVKEKIR